MLPCRVGPHTTELALHVAAHLSTHQRFWFRFAARSCSWLPTSPLIQPLLFDALGCLRVGNEFGRAQHGVCCEIEGLRPQRHRRLRAVRAQHGVCCEIGGLRPQRHWCLRAVRLCTELRDRTRGRHVNSLDCLLGLLTTLDRLPGLTPRLTDPLSANEEPDFETLDCFSLRGTG